ncbi:MAG TPA: hypothetical protein HPP51_00855 [Planctomycetes bacterium]|nr:hypothetical protein [Planctomycetota bacterium]
MGLAFHETGKYVSDRHVVAKNAGMLTAGQVAARLRKMGLAIKAKELKDFADEWHHSGFYKAKNGSTMGRTYFFYADTDIAKLKEQIEAKRAAGNRTAYVFKVKFERQTGYRGRKRWQPLAHFEAIEIPADDFCPNEISPEDYKKFSRCEGNCLEPYESFTDFKCRMES